MTPTQSARDAIAETRAAAGAAAWRSQAATDLNEKRWNIQALSPARAISESFTQKAGFAIHSVACAENIASPEGTTSRSPTLDHGKRWRARSERRWMPRRCVC